MSIAIDTEWVNLLGNTCLWFPQIQNPISETNLSVSDRAKNKITEWIEVVRNTI